ncbi:glycosyltransferase family 9 protein [Sphingomonas sp.]|uniref:glycosyltransferase family 9 protein n=1 Tax=Sphingomonas sp. TaxID=28214 RepID=UPI003B3A6489
MNGDINGVSGRQTTNSRGPLDRLRDGVLRPFLTEDVFVTKEGGGSLNQQAYGTVVSIRLLQDIVDYRASLQAWFDAVRIGGHLIIVVPHAFLAERQLALPVLQRPDQRRLYTPRVLMDEIEEALTPNSYRVRLLCDDDQEYDYGRSNDEPRDGHSDILLVVERIKAPDWPLIREGTGTADGPNYLFDPPRTRVEIARTRPHQNILILKLDHLGDFIIGIPALRGVRAAFPRAHITLVVGSWNLDLARGIHVADEVVAFDAFPRNSSEEEVDVPGKRALLETVLPNHYDLAIDMRTDTDTRTLLGRVRAALKAGLGTKADFPFLDIALPLDLGRTAREAAFETRLDHHAFHSQDFVKRQRHRAVFSSGNFRRGDAIIWGPYSRLRAGRYIFDPYLEIESAGEGLLLLDVAINYRRVTRQVITAGDATRLEFDVEMADSLFEFRIWALEEIPPPDFSFFGGRLVREGAPGEVHQSDYLELLVAFIARRMKRVGLLAEWSSP